MHEVVFIQERADTWEQLEAVVEEGAKVPPDEVADLYVQVTDDLAYARTFYPESEVVAYLNTLAQKTHRQLYRGRASRPQRVRRFWMQEVPTAIRNARGALLLSALLFAVAVAIGTLSALHDSSFVRLIMGEHYVNMTLQNISEGDPMAVYKQMQQTEMFVSIAVNNIYVSFLAFVLGIFFSLGTAYVLIQNGIMLGSFHILFYEEGLLWEALLVIYIHGTLEIAAIVVAGGAGLVLGNSFLFPGTLPRLVSLRRGAKQGLKIIIGLVPVFVVAALLEAFVTRYTEMPIAASLSVIVGSLVFLGWYFVYVPFYAPQSDNFPS